MFTSTQYELLDFGEGRKLERFGGYLLDRPAGGTEPFERSLSPSDWKQAARYTRTEGDRGKWSYRFPLPSTWEIENGRLVFEVKPTEFGHVGVFPEQAANWDWIADQVERIEPPVKVLNLFAYTGGGTLAAAAKGAEVVHIDAAENTVAWARQNAALSGLADAPIRWIVEDVEKFVRRELKRGNRYDAVILDPPSYGHGPKGEVWKIGEHLGPLLSMLAELTDGEPKFLLFNCHSAGYSPVVLKQHLIDAFDRDTCRHAEAAEMSIETADGRRVAVWNLGKIDEPRMNSPLITSIHNQRVKDAAKLRERRQRKKQGRTLIDGEREIRRAIQAGIELVEVFLCDGFCHANQHQAIIDELEDSPVAVLRCTPEVFGKVAFGERAEGIVAVATTPRRSLADMKLNASALVAVLVGLEKPGNVGAVLRSADAAGAAVVIIADGGTDPYNPNTIRASLGTIFAVPVCEATTTETLAWLRAHAFKTFAARVDGIIEFTQADFRGPTAIVLGSEAEGLPADWRGQDITAIKLPMRGVADSLNVSATAAVLFYEALRQRSCAVR